MNARQRTTAVFIDGSNLYETAKQLNFAIDFAKLPEIFEGDLLRLLYFTALPPKDVDSPLRRMVDFMEFNRYTVIQKQSKEYVNADTGITKTKGNMDIELTISAVKLVPFITDMALFSGDGDFKSLVEYAQERGVRVTVFSSRETPNPMISDDLRRQADSFVELASLRNVIGRAPNESLERAYVPWGNKTKRIRTV